MHGSDAKGRALMFICLATGMGCMAVGFWVMYRDWSRPPFQGMGLMLIPMGMSCVALSLFNRPR